MNYLDELHDDQSYAAEEVSPQSIAVLDSYVARGYIKINNDLRNGVENRSVPHLDSLMDNLPPSTEMIVHRAMSREEYALLSAGTTQNGYFSCSTGTEMGYAIAERADVVVKIHVPEGVPCILVDAVLGHSMEEEIIFERGLTLMKISEYEMKIA